MIASYQVRVNISEMLRNIDRSRETLEAEDLIPPTNDELAALLIDALANHGIVASVSSERLDK